eukprot:112755-Pyramimonas_sp.AAC.1
MSWKAGNYSAYLRRVLLSAVVVSRFRTIDFHQCCKHLLPSRGPLSPPLAKGSARLKAGWRRALLRRLRAEIKVISKHKDMPIGALTIEDELLFDPIDNSPDHIAVQTTIVNVKVREDEAGGTTFRRYRPNIQSAVQDSP